MHRSLTAAATAVLQCADADKKANLAIEVATAWQQKRIVAIGDTSPPARPARPLRPELKRPRDMPRRRLGSAEGRIALIHAIAHIELNAIDLAFDLIARFASLVTTLPDEFFDDWIAIGRDEARHYQLLQGRLQDLDHAYGDLPAHDGLWQAALDTRHDLGARLAIVPMILEARGLDVTPATVEKLRNLGDTATAEILETIYWEEIPHVAIGTKWFEWMARSQDLDPVDHWRELAHTYFKGNLKPPFNHQARELAGMARYDYGAEK